MTTTEDRKRGPLLGLAWGDVLGCPVEGWRDTEISAIYQKYDGLPASYPFSAIARMGPKRLSRLRPLGLHSDDTQQALGLILVCGNRGSWSLDDWTNLLVSGAKASAWRGTGRNFSAAVGALLKGTSPYQAASRSAGIGAAMRIAPLGAVFAGEPEALAEAVMESSLVTHGDLRAGSVAYAIAHSVSSLIEGRKVADVMAGLPEAVLQVEREWQGGKGWLIDVSGAHHVSTTLRALFADVIPEPAAIRTRVSALARPHLAAGFAKAHPNQGFALLGGLHALAMALCLEVEPQEVLLEIVRQGYDTDTVAAIAGGLLGARYGTCWIPTDRLVDHERLAAYAEALVDRRPPETHGSFLSRESELTRLEKRFQEQVIRDCWGCRSR
jgi:ADP-ribosylglycohydrolase